ncbi:MAG: MFS transporter [Gammaproteobacteria bacterium]|nr:MFS transporter [Gammaproteobacteria bacterium]
MSLQIRIRLSLMMFVQYFMFGAWFVTLGTYMHEGLEFDAIIGTAYGTQGIAAIISTLVFGAVADRYLSAQKLLGVLAIASGVILFIAARITTSPDLFLALILLHFLFFVPTIPLANSVALSCITDRSAEFPPIRVCGTAGWIVAGLLIGAMPGAAATHLPMQIAGAAGVVLGLYAFSLPDTPPAGKGSHADWRSVLGFDMMGKMRERNFAIFIIGVLIVLIPLAFYNTYSNAFLSAVNLHADIFGHRVEPAAIQTLGQVSEFVLLLSLPMFLRRFGVKGVLVIGMLAWSVRYLLFGYGFDQSGGDFAMLVTAVMLHGVCYDFFFVAGQIYVDENFEPALRARAQSFLVTINMGVGVVLGSNFANFVYRMNAMPEGGHDWRTIWLVPALIALLAGLAFALWFRPARFVQQNARPAAS